MLLGVAVAWVVWDALIALPDSRPITALNKTIKSLQSGKDMRASTLAMTAPRLRAVTGSKTVAHSAAVTATTETSQGRAAATLQNEKTFPAGTDKREQQIQAHKVSLDEPEATAASLKEAVAKGDRDAPVSLANMYFRGEGVPQSCEQALALLLAAAGKPNVRARNRLAAIYATGTCVQRDRVQAYHWLALTLALNPNDKWAQQNRALTWRQMTPEERSIADGDQ